MKPKIQKTYSPKPGDIERHWYVADAEGQTLGRFASEIAKVLRGKHKPTFAPHMDGGDYVVVINAGKIQVTGNKESSKVYYRHSGYPGGISAMTLAEMREKFPERIIERAVRGMLPKNKLGKQMLGKLRVYAGPDHPHAAQRPQPLVIGKVNA